MPTITDLSNQRRPRNIRLNMDRSINVSRETIASTFVVLNGIELPRILT